jgi:hypothetical protein
MNLRLIRSVSRHTTEPRVAICHGRVRTGVGREVAELRWRAGRCMRCRWRAGCWGSAGLEWYRDD